MERIAKHKSIIMLLKEGDNNIAYFHKSMNKRYNNNRMTSLQYTTSLPLYTYDEIKEAITNYFQDLFRSSNNQSYLERVVLQKCINHIVNEEINTTLTNPVTKEEIEKVMMSLNPDKSHGPDGFNSFFSRNHDQ